MSDKPTCSVLYKDAIERYAGGDPEKIRLFAAGFVSGQAEMMAKAKFPVAGMTVDDDGVKVNGIPYSQESSAKQIRIGLGIAAALHPDFRCVLVHDGSLLDEKSMVAVHEWGQEHDTLVLIERVTPSKGGVGVVITDGTVAGPIVNGEPDKVADGVHPDFDVRR